MENVPCQPDEGCRYYPDCFEDVDHLYWPRRNYKTQVEKQFRELDENKTLVCRALHEERHATERPPQKPPREVMIQAIAAHVIQEVA